MKTTIDIPEAELSDAICFTGANTKREAVVSRWQRMAELTQHAGTCSEMINVAELLAMRRRG